MTYFKISGVVIANIATSRVCRVKTRHDAGSCHCTHVTDGITSLVVNVEPVQDPVSGIPLHPHSRMPPDTPARHHKSRRPRYSNTRRWVARVATSATRVDTERMLLAFHLLCVLN
ncbi:hypothetical protein E2C01_037135 [Portunus trituberculatus]|uniref:Uncharacterized protein n=1 Tax=Portunus trituberculatus TaxID=210409 RepID=A0A5B7FDU4_PORTR|nr:hypothetical protein [Portunus trituberculatus]